LKKKEKSNFFTYNEIYGELARDEIGRQNQPLDGVVHAELTGGVDVWSSGEKHHDGP
jgi:hypothetical protein